MRISLIIFGLILLGLFWCFYGDESIHIAQYFTERSSLTIQEAGAWGDSFGAFNALVSTIAAGAVVVTLFLQQRSIRSQEKDLHRQRFESNFFELLRLMRELRSEIRFRHTKQYATAKKSAGKVVNSTVDLPGIEHKGVVGIDRALAELLFWHAEYANRGPLNRIIIGNIYDEKVGKINEYSISPYFRMIYTLLYRVSNDGVLSEYEKQQYGNLVRSQLTSRELHLIAYNACSGVSKDLTQYIEKFRLFKYMRSSAGRRRIEGFFKSVAFEKRT